MSDQDIKEITLILTEVRERMARVEERVVNKTEDLERRITNLEKAKMWVIAAVLAYVINEGLKLI